MNLAKFSIENNRITFLLLAIIIVLGVSVYQSLPRDSMPPYTVRAARVISSFPGASPERVEQLVTDKIEKIAQELPELKEVSSTSRTGLSIVSVVLKNEVAEEDLQNVWDRLRRKLNSIPDLPQGVYPNLQDEDVGVVYGIAVALSSDGFSYAEMEDYAEKIKDSFIKLDEAAKVELGGVQDERVFIEFDDARLSEYNLTASKLQNILATTNIVSSGGEINLEDERIIMEPTGNFNSIEDIRKTLIPVGNTNQLVYLEDISIVKKGYINPAKQEIRIKGNDAISFHISLKSGSNVIALGEEVDRVIEQWNARLPLGLELQRVASVDTYIDKKISDFIANLIQAILIVMAVMLIFLGIRTGLVIASLIPIVTIMTLMIMGLINVGLNQVTLAALIMALGMMVDNAIVVAESIMVKMSEGVAAKDAAIKSCSELFAPLLISTLTTSAAFLAFYLAESTMGDIVGPIFVVISIALLSSWIIALTVVTMFCYMFLKVEKKGESKPGFIDRIINAMKGFYKNLILKALAYRRLVVVGLLGTFLFSLFGFTFIPFVFFPDSDRNLITVDINLPLGTRIERTSELVLELEQFMKDSLLYTPGKEFGILDWSSYIGSGPESYDLGYGKDEANSSYAHILVNTSDAAYNNALIERLDRYSFNQFPNADIKVGPLAAGGGGTPIEVKVSGENQDQLAEIAESIKLKLATIQGTKNIKDDWGPQSKKFVVVVDQARAQNAGLTNQDIAISLQTVLDGISTGEYREGNKTIPIMMRSDVSQQQTLNSLETMNIYSQGTGRSVPFLQVASVQPEWQYSKIKRLDLNRTVNVSSELAASGNASAITATLTPWLEVESSNWPVGYSYKLGGDAENTAENMGAVIKYLPLAGIIIIILLVVQFNSFRKMVMVTLTIPLGVIGVVIGLLLFQEPFGFMPFLGVISLAGIVINNAIVLIDRIEIEQDQMKRSEQDAIIAACLQRFRPIILATFTTVLGLIPLYLSGGEMWEGMAISIMIGLLFGTVITLVFIPSLYSLLFKVDYKNYTFNKAQL